jgi:hypothetical protein
MGVMAQREVTDIISLLMTVMLQLLAMVPSQRRDMQNQAHLFWAINLYCCSCTASLGDVGCAETLSQKLSS